MYVTMCEGLDLSAPKVLRREPPMPLGEVDYFSVSAATPPGAMHPSGISLRIRLENPHPDRPFRSSQLVNGRVHIYSPNYLRIPNLSLRVYFESRTLYWNLEPRNATNKFDQTMASMKSAAAQDYDSITRHEVHRGVVPASNVTLSWGAPVEIQPNQELVLPFSFIVPRKMTITEYNNNPRAPRDLCPVERCPPSTLRDSRYGSVQWIVEAIMDLVPSAESSQDPDTLLRYSTNDQIITRIAFPFVPSLQDVSPLRDEPFFGDDSQKNSFGIKRLSEEEIEAGKKGVLERIRARGGKWEAYVKGFSVGRSNVYTPDGALVSTDAAALSILVFLEHTGSQSSLKSLFRAGKHKPVHVRRAVVVLLRTTSTRGGKERTAHVRNTIIRQQEFVFDGQSSSSSGIAIFYEATDPIELDLTLDLQSAAPGNHQSIPAKFYTPSFRTPNFQYEFYLTVSLLFAEDDTEWFVGRFPVQITPATDEDGNRLPAFEDAVGGSVIPPTFNESIRTSY